MNQASSILGAIYRRTHIVLLVMGGSIGVGLYLNATQPPDFMATAEIMIPEHALGLSISTEGGNVPESPLLPLQDEGRLIGVTSLLRSRAVVYRVAELLPDTDPQRLKSNVRGDVSKDGVVEYTGYGRTAEESVAVANAAVLAFSEVLEKMSMTGMEANLKTFKDNEEGAREKVVAASDAITAYLVSLQTPDLSADIDRWLEERNSLERNLFDLEGQKLQYEAQRPIIESTLAERPEFVLTRQELQLPGSYSSSLERISNLSSQLAVARLQYRDAHPEIVRLQTELDMARTQATGNADLVLSASTMSQDRQVAALAEKLVDIDIFDAGYTAQKDIYENRRTELDGLLEGVPGYRQELGRLQADFNQARSMADRITSRREELEFHLAHGLKFSVIDEYAAAHVDRAKQVPTQTGILMFTSFSGLLLGIFVALLTATFGRMRATRPY